MLPRLVGRCEIPDRDLYLAVAEDIRLWPDEIERPRSFIVVTALDTRELSSDELNTFTRKLVDQGCRCSCTWGPGAGAVDVAFDLASIEADEAGAQYADEIMTSSHEDETLDEALWYAIWCGSAPTAPIDGVLAVVGPQWAEHVRARFADPEKLNDDVLEAEDDAT
jgi:hypothetical protein